MEGATGGRGGAAAVIGIGEYLYTQQVWPLRYAARDAEAITGVLSNRERVPERLGRYEILRRLGQGGMGTV
jgi:hypothetical protein